MRDPIRQYVVVVSLAALTVFGGGATALADGPDDSAAVTAAADPAATTEAPDPGQVIPDDPGPAGAGVGGAGVISPASADPASSGAATESAAATDGAARESGATDPASGDPAPDSATVDLGDGVDITPEPTSPPADALDADSGEGQEPAGPLNLEPVASPAVDPMPPGAPVILADQRVKPSGVKDNRGDCVWTMVVANANEVGVYYKLTWRLDDGTVVGEAILDGPGDHVSIPAWQKLKLTVVAVAKPGYALQGKTSWTETLPRHPGCPVIITPIAPRIVTADDCVGSRFTVPAVNGVTYRVDPDLNPRFLEPGESVTITATALPGYAFPSGAQTQWDLSAPEKPASCDKEPPTPATVLLAEPQVTNASRDCTVDPPADTQAFVTLTQLDGIIEYTFSASGSYTENTWTPADNAGSVTIDVVLLDDVHYQFPADHDQWWPLTITWDALDECPAHVNVDPISWTPATCEDPDGSYWVPTVEGVDYWIEGDLVDPAGSFPLPDVALNAWATPDGNVVFDVGATTWWQVPAHVAPTGCDLGTDPEQGDDEGASLVLTDPPTPVLNAVIGPRPPAGGATPTARRVLATTGADPAVSVIAAATLVGLGTAVLMRRRRHG